MVSLPAVKVLRSDFAHEAEAASLVEDCEQAVSENASSTAVAKIASNERCDFVMIVYKFLSERSVAYFPVTDETSHTRKYG